jgi:cell division protein FtsB
MNLSRGRRVRERREEREERERKVEWVVVLLGVLVIMMGYLAMKGRGGGGRREDTEGLSQQVQLHLQPYRFDYIKYPRNIDNITQFNQEIKEQIDNVLTDYSLKDIQLISLLSNKV